MLLFIISRNVIALETEKKVNPVIEAGQGKVVNSSHDIQYEENLAPAWKQIWDRARALVREDKFGEALVQYELLLARKDNVDEARWEYASLAIHQDRFAQAEKQLEILLKNDPENPKYKLAYGDVLFASGKPQLALNIYQQLNGSLGADKYLGPVMQGLVKVFEQEKKYEEMLAPLEKLLVIKPADPVLLKKTLFVLIQLQQHEKAIEYLTKLQQIVTDDVEVLRLQARLQKQLGEDDNSASTWQRLIALKADDLEAHKQLEMYYRKLGNRAMELKHIEFNLSIHPEDGKLLSRAAQLNLEMKRADRALNYYVSYLAKFSDDKEIIEKKLEVEKIVAKDLLILVENKNASVLWEDLHKVTVDGLGVFKAIAVLLRENDKKNLLIDVLIIINKEEPGNEAIARELVLLLLNLKRTDELMELVPDYDKYLPPKKLKVKN